MAPPARSDEWKEGAMLTESIRDRANGVADAVALIAPLETPAGSGSRQDVATTLTALLADASALYLKTRTFQLRVLGHQYRDYHLMLEAQTAQLFVMSDALAERIRKIGGTTLRSIGYMARLDRVEDIDAEDVALVDLLTELRADNERLTDALRVAHDLCDERGDVVSAHLIEDWIADAESRIWFFYETARTIVYA
jgi:starvation-inducible DNA-binding protein